MQKTCRTCGIKKNLEEFYAHKAMKDNRLNNCKDCVKNRIHLYWKDGRGKVVDAKRQKSLTRRLWQKDYSKTMKKKHRPKYETRTMFWNWFRYNKQIKENCSVCGTNEKIEAHHPDYNKPYDVLWLCALHHKEWHRQHKAIEAKKVLIY